MMSVRHRSYLLPLWFGTGSGAVLYRLIVGGQLTIDLGIGRRTQDLGPLRVDIASTSEVVFDVIAAPYLGRTPRAMHDKLVVLERSTDMVLAAHFTELGRGGRATTVETVRFERPHTVHFRLARGPVPEVYETFQLVSSNGGTTLTYQGTLGTDLWGLGKTWGAVVARKWVAAVEQSLQSIKAEAERRSAKAHVTAD
jgi:Polyketide cyclase / dehydrase and lipid transport